MNTQKMTMKVNGKNVEFEFIARSELTREQFMNLNPAVGEPTARWQSVSGQDDLDDQDDSNLNTIAQKLGTPRFVYRWQYI